jgi:hypothetical protein
MKSKDGVMKTEQTTDGKRQTYFSVGWYRSTRVAFQIHWIVAGTSSD